jgi:hypothetical protein
LSTARSRRRGRRPEAAALTPLPADFLKALEGREELLVSSRDERTVGTVPAWFAVGPPGVIYLFTLAHSRKAQRWRRDPWVRLRVPQTDIAAEGAVRVVDSNELDAIAPLIVERWDMAGATTVEAVHQLVHSGAYIVVVVEGAARGNCAG